MNRAAKAAGVHHSELPRDNASRDKVQALARQVESSSAGAAQKAAVAAAFKAYEDTWPPEEEDEQDDEDEVVGFRLRGTSFLLTYNWDFFGKPPWIGGRTWMEPRTTAIEQQMSTSTQRAGL